MISGKYGPNTAAVEKFAAWCGEREVVETDAMVTTWDRGSWLKRYWARMDGEPLPCRCGAASYACAALVVRDIMPPEDFALFTAPFADEYDFDAMAPRAKAEEAREASRGETRYCGVDGCLSAMHGPHWHGADAGAATTRVEVNAAPRDPWVPAGRAWVGEFHNYEPREKEVRVERIKGALVAATGERLDLTHYEPTGRHRAVRGPGIESAFLSTGGRSRPVAECVKGCLRTFGAKGCMHERAP